AQFGGARRNRLPDYRGIIVARQREAARVALKLVAGFAGEGRELPRALCALGQHRELKTARKPDHRADDGGGLAVLPEIGDEGLIDLDLVEWERLQIGQR